MNLGPLYWEDHQGSPSNFFYYFFFFYIHTAYLFIYFWLHWDLVVAHRLSLAAESGGYSCFGTQASHGAGFFWGAQALGAQASVVAAHGSVVVTGWS